MSEQIKLRKLLGALFALVLGLGYLSAFANLYFTMHLADGLPGMSMEDISVHFHGNPTETLLATKIKGSMRVNLKDDAQFQTMMNWIAGGAKREDFEPVNQILQAQCVRCHNQNFFRPLVTYEDVAKTTVLNTAMSWARLALISHQHLFGIGLLCFALGWLLSQTALAYKFKASVIVLGFVSVLIDIGGWWLTRLSGSFAFLVIVGGALSGLFFGLGIFSVWYDALLAKGAAKE